jgi:hypothetical protein
MKLMNNKNTQARRVEQLGIYRRDGRAAALLKATEG